jgi:PAS domain S-box-containing protein
MLTGLARLKALTATLDDHEQQICEFFDSSPDLFCLVDQDGQFVRINNAWSGVIGRNLDETFTALVHDGDKPIVRELFERLHDSDVSRLRLRVMCKDWKYRIIEFSASQWREGVSSLVGRIVPESHPELMVKFSRRTHGNDQYKTGE